MIKVQFYCCYNDDYEMFAIIYDDSLALHGNKNKIL